MSYAATKKFLPAKVTWEEVELISLEKALDGRWIHNGQIVKFYDKENETCVSHILFCSINHDTFSIYNLDNKIFGAVEFCEDYYWNTVYLYIEKKPAKFKNYLTGKVI